jgi:hypothetical protein
LYECLQLQTNQLSDLLVEASHLVSESASAEYCCEETLDFRRRLGVALRSPASSQGLTIVLVRLCADIASVGPGGEKWSELLTKALSVQAIVQPVQLDRRIVAKTKGLATIKLFASDAEDFGRLADVFKSIRLKTVLQAVQLDRPISQGTVQTLRRARLALSVGADVAHWVEVFEKLDGSAWPKEPGGPRRILDRTNQEGLAQALTSLKDDAVGVEQEPPTTAEPKSQRAPLLPFPWLKGQQLFCSVADTAGVLTAWDCYTQPEFDHAIAWMGEKLTDSTEANTAGTALLSILTGLPPLQLSQLAVSQAFDNEEPIHIEWTRGLVWLEVARLIEQTEVEPAETKGKRWSRWMAVPLPYPLHRWLMTLTKAHTQKGSVGDILGRSSADLKSDIKKLFTTARRPDRGLHLSFLRRSYSRRILAHCRDEAYAGLVGFDMTLTTTANFNYLSICPRRIWEICTGTFAVCGLGEPVRQPALPSAGSRFLLADEDVQRLLADALGKARNAAHALPHKCGFDTLRSIHTLITTAVTLLLTLSTGHRAAEVYSFRVDAVDLTLGEAAAVISDKVTAEYHRRRIVPLTDCAVRWLRFYFTWISVLAYRLERINRALAHQVVQVRLTAPAAEPIPVLFALSAKQQFLPVGSSLVTASLLNLKTTNAPGRHWLDRVLREAGVDGASITGLMGRGLEGQELFETHSRERYRTWLERTRAPIEKKLAEFDLPAAPEFSGRAMPDNSIGHSSLTRTRSLEKKVNTTRSTQQNASSPTHQEGACPVDWDTLFHSRAFGELTKTTRSVSRSSGAIRLTWELSLHCGLARPEQVMAAFEAIKQQVRHRDEFGEFVDWTTPTFGLRRTYLPPSIRDLRQKYAVELKGWSFPTAQELSDVVEARGFPRTGIKDPIAFLCRCAQAYINLEMPAAIAAWSQGRLFSRLAKPIATSFLQHPPGIDAAAQALGTHPHRSEKSPEDLELRELREALILRTSDLQSNPGLVARNRIALTRLKKFKGQQKTIAGQSVWCLFDQVLTSGAQPGTASSYLSSIVGELLVVASRISHADFTSEDGKRYFLQQLIEQLRTVENSEEESKNWTTSINHLGRSWGIQLNLRGGQEINAPPSQYAPMATPEIVQLACDWILAQLHIPRMDRIRAATICTLHACFGARQPEIDALRLQDLVFDDRGNLSHLVIHPSAGGRKTANAKRTIPIVGGKFDMTSVKDWLNQRSSECAGRGHDRGDAYLFGAARAPKELVSTDEDRKLIGHALKTFGGSEDIDVRAFRHGVASQKVAADLSPFRTEPRDGLEARQLLINTTISMGHGHVCTTWRHYVHGAELLMAHWLDHRLALGIQMPNEAKPPPSWKLAGPGVQAKISWKPPVFLEAATFLAEKARGVDSLLAARRADLPDTWIIEIEEALIELGIRQLDSPAKTGQLDINLWIVKVAPFIAELHTTPGFVSAATRCISIGKDHWPIQNQGDFDQLILPIASMLDGVGLRGVLTLYPPSTARWQAFAHEKHWASSVEIRVANNRNRHGDQMAVRFAHQDHMTTSIARHAPAVTTAISACVLALLTTHLLKLKFNV